MKLLDLNLLLYAVNEDAPHHARAKRWLEETLSGTETVALAWTVMLGFLRLSTRSSVFPTPLSLDEAFVAVNGWLAQPCVTVIDPGARHTSILENLLRPLGTGGNLTSDAHLAALAIEHGAELCSSDNDFDRFPGLRRTNPLA